MDKNITLNNTNDPTQVSGPQVGMHTLEKNFADKIGREVDSVMTTVETRVENVEMTAIENLVIPTVELAMKSVDASSGRGAESVVQVPHWRDFSGNIESLQMTVPTRMNSHTGLYRIEETRSSTTVEGGDLTVKKL